MTKGFPLPFSATGLWLVLVLLAGFSLTACQRTVMPKPMATPRLTYPETTYSRFNRADCPFQFDYPSFFSDSLKPVKDEAIRWVDFRWERYGLTLYTTYQRVADSRLAAEQPGLMAALLETKRPRGTTVEVKTLVLPRQGFTAYVFRIEGTSAIPLEFLLTDGRQHCFSGRLLFDTVPDREAMTDILAGLMTDMLHLMDSFTVTLTP